MLFQLESIEKRQMTLYRDAWLGNKEGNVELRVMCSLKFEQISDPAAISPQSRIDGWVDGRLKIFVTEQEAEKYELGKSYWFGDDAVPVIGSI